MNETERWLAAARRFAAALDACDYATADEFLAADCHYDGPRGSYVGPEAIIDSYRESDARGRRQFDGVSYRSEATPEGPGRVRLTYIDEIRYRSTEHTYRCCQILRFNRQGEVEHIEHVELPGERECFREFCRTCGIRWE